MIRVALLGYGKMGKRLEELAPEHGFTVALRIDSRTPFEADAYREAGIEVAIDFSVPSAVVGNVERMAALGIPLVVGTTGWLSDLATVRAAAPDTLRDAFIFDIYTGAQVGAAEKSVAIGLILQDTSRTLTDVDADSILQGIRLALGREWQARIRE